MGRVEARDYMVSTGWGRWTQARHLYALGYRLMDGRYSIASRSLSESVDDTEMAE